MKSIGFLIYPGVEELDFVGPWEMVTMWREYAGGPARIETVAEDVSTLKCAKGLKVIPDTDFATATNYDILFVAGGFAAFEAIKSPALISFVQRQAQSAQYVASVCTGAFILHAAGLLEGKTVVTHWKAADMLANLSGVTAGTGRYIQDGNIWTSAGVSAGMDLALAMIAEIDGSEAAAIVQHNAEYFPDGKLYQRAKASQKAAL